MGHLAESAYRVTDPAGLALVVARLVEAVGEGSQAEAARVMGVPQPRLSDYLKRRRRGMAVPTARRLLLGIRALPRGERARWLDAWNAAVASPGWPGQLGRPARRVLFDEPPVVGAELAACERAKRRGEWWSRPNVWRRLRASEADAFLASGRPGTLVADSRGDFDLLEVEGTPAEREEMGWGVLAELNTRPHRHTPRFRRLAGHTLRALEA